MRLKRIASKSQSASSYNAIMGDAEVPPFAQAAAGATGSIVSNTIVYPLDLVSTRVQTTRSKAVAGSSWKALREIVRAKGVQGLYQGLGADNLSNTVGRKTYLSK